MRTEETKMMQRKNKGKLDRKLIPGNARPSGPEQTIVREKLPFPPVKLTSQSSTGLISYSYTPSLSLLTKATSLKDTFDGWRLTDVWFNVYPVGANGGCTKFIVDDEDATLPNSTFAAARPGTVMTNNSSNSKSVYRHHWRAQDLSDLEFYSTQNQSTYTPVALKIYTDLTTYITQPSTDLWLIEAVGSFEFRGIGAAA